MRTLKPRRWWGITYINGNDVMPDTIRRTRAAAIMAVAEQRAGGLRDWEFWKSRGCRPVRVNVTIEVK